ncbi:hypothetical protein [Luteolibacter sp. AS25]|uniref:hypothetical protein n=1 Tax=Luteolibacter sp. AS25 TaxID=3135776 RepID=UPI00398B0A9E
MKPDLHDAHNDGSNLSQEDEWDDSDDVVAENPKVLPERKQSLSPSKSESKTADSSTPVSAESEKKLRLTKVQNAGSSGKNGKKRSQVFEIGSKSEKKSVSRGKPSVAPAAISPEAVKDEESAKRRRNNKDEQQNWGQQTQDTTLKWMLVSGILVVAGIVVLALFLSQIIGKKEVRESQKSIFSKIAPVVSKFEAAENGAAEATVTEKLMIQEQRARSIIEAYLKAKTPDDFSGFIRKSDEIMPLVEKFWKPIEDVDEDWKLGSNSNWRVIRDGGLHYAILNGENPDFTEYTAYFVLEGEDIKLDWKASSGYSSANFADLMKGEGDASEVRVWMSPADFYTFSLPDGEFMSFRLSAPNREQNLWGYVPREGKLFEEIIPFFAASQISGERKNEVQVILKLVEGPEGSIANQWIIEDVLGESWIDGE